MATTKQDPIFYYEAGTLEGHGNDYQRLMACVLLQKAMLKNERKCESDFKLAFEVKGGGKFDDIGIFTNGGWYLVQTKHAQSVKGGPYLLTRDMLFKGDDKSFGLLKYLKEYRDMKWNHGDIKNIILFTNRVFEGAESYPEAKLDDLMKFPTGRHIQLGLEDFERETFKCFYNKIFTAMINLFNNKKMDAIIIMFNVFLKEILVIDGEFVQLTKQNKYANPDIQKLYNALTENCKDKSVPNSIMSDFWIQTKNLIITGIDEKTVKDFFSKLVLSIGQPDLIAIQQEIKDKGFQWMRSWMQAECFGKLDAGFSDIFLNKYISKFKEYENTLQVVSIQENGKDKMLMQRQFLQVADGKTILKELQNEIQQATKGYYGSLEHTISYYINRKFFIQNSKYSDLILDTEFIEILYTTFSDKNCFVLTAQPGMGKSILWQYLATETQKMHLDKLVFLIKLNNLRGEIVNINTLEDILTNKVLDTILSRSNIEKIVKETTKPMLLFLDAFDELRERNQCNILNLINLLLVKKNVKVIISGRKHVKERLEKQLNVVSLGLTEFNRDEQISFLERFWNKNDDDRNKVRKFSEKLLEKFHKYIASKDYDFTGIPLKIRMIADIYDGPLNKYLMPSDDDDDDDDDDDVLTNIISEEKLSVPELYDAFMFKGIKSSKIKYLNADKDNFPDSIHDPITDDIYYGYQVFAVEQNDDIYYSNLKALLTTKRYHETLQTFKRNAKHNQSVAFQIVVNEPRFTHLTFEEFCIAKFLFNFIGQTKVKFYTEKFIQYFKNKECIRNFFLEMINDQIAKGLKSHPHILKSLEYFGEDIIIWSITRDYINIVKSLYDSVGKKIFYNQPLLQIAIENQAKQTEKFIVEQKAYQYPLHIAVEFNRLDLIETYISDIHCKDDKGRTPILLAKSVEVFEYLLRNDAQLDIKDKNKNTILHYAALSSNVDFFKEIHCFKDSKQFCLSEYTFCRNNYGETPLDIAASVGKIEIVLFFVYLVNYSNYDELDYLWNNQLMLPKTYYRSKRIMNKTIEKYLENNENNSNEIERFIKAYQYIGMDINSLNYDRNTVLHIASAKNCIELVASLFLNGADLEIQNLFGQTPLHKAVSNDSYEVVEFLVTKVKKLSLKDYNGDTVLHLAARLNDSKCLELLIKKYQSLHLSLDEKNDIRLTALNWTIEEKRGTNFQLLLNAGALPNLYFIGNDNLWDLERFLQNVFDLTQIDFCLENEDSKKMLKKLGCDIDWSKHLKKNTLHDAAYIGLVNVVKLLIVYNFDLNALNSKNQTPLMVARKEEIFEILISAGAESNLTFLDGNTWLHNAAQNQSKEMILHFLEKDPTLINSTNRFGETALHIAAKNNDKENIELLIQQNADVNIKDNKGNTAIIYTIKSRSYECIVCLMKHSAKGDLLDNNGLLKEDLIYLYSSEELVELLLKEKNFNINAANKEGLTPLHIVLQYNRLEILSFFVKEGADVDAEDNYGKTPLHYAAAESCSNEILSYLIEYCGNINHKNKREETPLHLSITDITKVIILLAKKACPDLANNDGNTPLHLAILRDQMDVSLLLIDHSSELNRQNNNGNTALHLAILKNNFEIVKKLVDKKVKLSLKNVENKTALDLVVGKWEQRDIFKLLVNKFKKINLETQQINSRTRKRSVH